MYGAVSATFRKDGVLMTPRIEIRQAVQWTQEKKNPERLAEDEATGMGLWRKTTNVALAMAENARGFFCWL